MIFFIAKHYFQLLNIEVQTNGCELEDFGSEWSLTIFIVGILKLDVFETDMFGVRLYIGSLH